EPDSAACRKWDCPQKNCCSANCNEFPLLKCVMAAGLKPSPPSPVPAPPPVSSDLMLGPGKRYWKDRFVRYALFLAALSSIAVTTGIVAILLAESAVFFRSVSLWEFLTDVEWSPSFDPPHHGILPLVTGTVVTTAVALAVALPVGTMIAIYLSE